MLNFLVSVFFLAMAQFAYAAESTDCTLLAGRTVRWLVPSVPGGGYDAYSRLIQPFLEESLNARIIIENRPEAGGIVAAMAVRDAQPDGSTIGIINASGLLAANLMAEGPAPDPVADFTVLARVVQNRMVLLTGRDSGIPDLQHMVALSARRPVVVAVRDAGSASFYALPIVMDLAALDYEVVTGYVGSTARALAALRGDVDLIIQNFDSVRQFVESGELLPLLSIADSAAFQSGTGMPEDIPVLGGAGGFAVQRAPASGKTPASARRQAAALSSIVSAGRLVVAPGGLSPELQGCLEIAMSSVMTNAELQQAAKRVGLSLDFASAADAKSALENGRLHMAEFAPLVRAAIDRVSQ